MVPRDVPAISARGLHYSYRGREVLHDVHIDLQRGAVTAIAGPNGSGKSTLLEILAGVRTPSKGEVRRSGEVSLVVQRPSAPETLPLTVRDTVSMGTWGRRIGRLRARGIVSEMIDAVGLTGLDSRPLTELSGGQRQRTLLAQALARQADIVLMDEPDAGLDTASRHHIHELLVDQAVRRGAAVGCATHDEGVIATADRIVRLEPGLATTHDLSSARGDAPTSRARGRSAVGAPHDNVP